MKTSVVDRRRVSISFADSPSMTKQSFKEECDINHLIKRYKKTGVVTHLNALEAQYGDLGAVDFQEAMDIVVRANGLFADLPSKVRKRFGNDPAAFLEFMNSSENADEMIALGLATRREVDNLVSDSVSSGNPAGLPEADVEENPA